MNKKHLLVIVAIILVIGFFVFFCFKGKNNTEGYSNIGDIDNVGSLDTSYELIPSADSESPAPHFADLIQSGDQMELVKSNNESIRPMERLERLQGSQLLPRMSSQVTPYNVDVADPVTYSFAVNAPRVQLKNRLANQADPYRGDIPIRFNPNIPMVAKSSYERDSQRLDGFFSDHYVNLYNRNTGQAYKNMPIKVSNGETIMDFVN